MLTQHNSSALYNNTIICKVQCKLQLKLQLFVPFTTIRYVDLYSALDDKYLVHKALRRGSHSSTCKQHHACL